MNATQKAVDRIVASQALTRLVTLAVPAVRGAAKRAERKAAYEQRRASPHFMGHLDRACLWRFWLTEAERLVEGLAAAMPEDHLRDFHNANDLAEIAALRRRLEMVDALVPDGESG